MAGHKASHFDCKRGIRRSLILTLAAVIALSSGLIAPGATLKDRYPGVEEEATLLAPGIATERELVGGQKHSYRVDLSEGQFAAVIVEQQGIDVIVRAFGVDGKLIAERDSEIRLNGRETADLVSATTGSYRIEIESKYKMFPSGRYEILLDGLREATDQDRLLQEARALHGEAVRLSAAGKYDQARASLERSLEIRRQMPGPNQTEAARSLMLMGNICYYKDDSARAEALYKEAAEIFETTLGPDNPLLATCFNNLASLYQVTGKLVKSEELHLTALRIRESALPSGHPDVAQSLNNLANVYRSKGDFISAEPLYARALDINEKILGPNHINLASPLSNLASLYVSLDDYEKAERLFQRSLDIRQKGLAPDHPEIAGVLNRLGLLYYDKGEYARAEEFLQQAHTIWEKKFGANHSQVAAVLGNLGRVYRALNDYEKAESFYQRSLAIKQIVLGAQHPETASMFNNLARLYMARGDYAGAVSFQSRAIAATEHNIGLNLASGSERQKLAYLASIRTQLNDAISLHVRYDLADGSACNLAVSTVLQRKGRVLDAMSGSLAALRRRFSAQDQALFEKVNSVTTSLATLVLGGPEKKTPADYQKAIKALEEQRETLESEISRRSGGFYERPHQLVLSEIQSAIPDDAALIEFAVYRPVYPDVVPRRKVVPHYVAYIIRRNEVRWKELGEAKAIDDAVTALGKALRDPRRKDFQALARAADDKVMRPIRDLVGESKHLLVSPDGLLNLIPFEALVDEQGKYLVERYSVSYLTSGRDLLRLKVARSSKTNPIVVAAPLFERVEIARAAVRVAPIAKQASPSRTRSRTRQRLTSGKDLSSVYFTSLAGTSQEAQAIKLLFPETSVLTGARASESALKRVDAPRILHIATHGFFLQDATDASLEGVAEGKVFGTRAIKASVKVENPLLRSGLALAGANSNIRGDDDGILTALEASSLNLWGTKLVTLSACDTGVGEVRNGEGVYGLRRAFVLAGTETLVMSLWPVSDYVTRELMTAYYKGLKQGQGRGEALRQVQLSMLKRRGREHPFYWASFIQSGEWANLDGKR